MANLKRINLTEAEEKLAELIWREAPLTSPELVAFAEAELDWKKSTTYTVLKKLCEKAVFKNEKANITVLLTREEQIARQSRSYVEDTFGGSLPKFISAFIGGGGLSPGQAAEIQRLIDGYEETDNR